MFGGCSREPFNDTVIITDQQEENGFGSFAGKQIENIGDEGIDFPQRRYGNSLCAYQNKIFMFGGGGPYNQQGKIRPTYNDIRIFDCCKNPFLR